MELSQLQDQINLESDAIAVLLVGVALFLVLYLNRRRAIAAFQEWRIQHSMKRIGCEQIRDFTCPDGLDGYYNIDRLALIHDAILVISYKPYGGNIYCAESISEWTQVVDQKSFKFTNPLFELENQITALKCLLADTSLRGYLFFNHSALFPKGHPPAVLNPDSIPENFLNCSSAAVNPSIRAAWEQLKQRQMQAGTALQAEGKT